MNTAVYGILIGLCLYAFATVDTCPSGTGTRIPATHTVDISCNSLLSPTFAVITVLWTNEQNSTLSYNITTTNVNGVATSTNTGIVTNGAFAGQSYTAVVITTAPDILDCETASGVTSVSGGGVGFIGLNLITISDIFTFSPGLNNTEQSISLTTYTNITLTTPPLSC